MNCEYESGKMSGLDCPCVKCGNIKNMLIKYIEEKKIYISGTEEDIAKLRKI